MNPLFYIPILGYAYVAIKYGWHVAKCDQVAGDSPIFVFDFAFACILFPIAVLVILSDNSNRYDGFRLAPPLPTPTSAWEKEQKRINAERAAADLAVEQARVRTEHRKHLEKRQRELNQIMDSEADRLAGS